VPQHGRDNDNDMFNVSYNDLTLSAAVNCASAASMQFILMAYRPSSVCSWGRCVSRSLGCCWHRPQACEISLSASDLFPITSRHMMMCSSNISWNTDKIGLLSTTRTQEDRSSLLSASHQTFLQQYCILSD
jgi:hypothetical protein